MKLLKMWAREQLSKINHAYYKTITFDFMNGLIIINGVSNETKTSYITSLTFYINDYEQWANEHKQDPYELLENYEGNL